MLRTDFQPLKANTDDDVAMLLFNRFVDNVARAFKAIERAAGAPGGLALLDGDGVVPADELGGVVNPATLHLTATAIANSPIAVTLPAVGGKFHYITAIQLVRVSSGAAVAAGAQLVHTSTNLPGNPAWSAGNALPAGGTVIDLDYQPANPLRSLQSGTPTIINMVAGGAACINRINVSYLVAP